MPVVDLSKTYIRCRYRPTAIMAAGNTSYDKCIPYPQTNDLFSATIAEENNVFRCTVQLKQDLAIELLSVTFIIPSANIPSAYNRQYILQPVGKSLWNNDLTPLHIQYQHNGRNLLVKNVTKFLSHKITPATDHFKLELFIDAAGLHPQINYENGITKSSASPIIKTGRQYTISFSIIETNAAPYPVINRYPNGLQSAFVLTDHCDFDTTANLKKFANGNNGQASWLTSGLKITKGVFANASQKKGFMAATLAMPEYKVIIDELYSSGNEIAPHALNQSGQIDPNLFIASLDVLKKTYDCRSWIEHGNYLSYSYYMGGKSNKYRLIEQLEQRGYNNIWSYYDVAINPFSSINLFSTNVGKAATDAMVISRKLLRGQFLYAFHVFRSYFTRHNNGQKYIAYLLGLFSKSRQMFMSVIKRQQVKKGMKQFLQALAGKDNKHIYTYTPFTNEEICHFSPVLFSEAHGSLSQLQPDDILMFATQEVVHTSDIYNEQALLALIKEKGLHIGHTYILNQLPYINGIFTKNGQLKEEWIVFVEALKKLSGSKAIWSCNMGELAAYLKAIALLDITYHRQSITITNKSRLAAAGITFSMPYTGTIPNMLWNNRQLDPSCFYTEASAIVFWGDIPAEGSISIEW